MSKRKCWSRSVGAQRGMRVRVFERVPNGNLYLAVWNPRDQKMVKRSLGHKDRDRAVRQALELAARRPAGEQPRKPPALGELLSRYVAENRYTSDGSLKTESYRNECKRYARYLTEWFGADCDPNQITAERARAYARARRAGKVNGKLVGITPIRAELKFLKAGLEWATSIFKDRRPLLERNYLRGYSVPKERDPKRPVITWKAVRALLEVAPRVHRLLPVLIVLMDTTGRRLSSVLGVRWDDFDFQKKTIRWRPELDKRKRTWVTPMPSSAEKALVEARAHDPSIGTTLVFPHPKDARKPVSPDLAAYWLKRAYKLAGIERAPGGLWHPFRRKWATERKRFPLKDVADAGGWSDPTTLVTCYQHSDWNTMREVIEGPSSRSASL